MREKSTKAGTREKSTKVGTSAREASTNMDNFVSVFHASSLEPQQTQSQPQPSMDNPYCYIPEQYWQTLDYYDMAMDICPEFPDVRLMPESAFASKSVPDIVCSSVAFLLQ